eukprot:scaffold78886_cov51-Attheya_sp.AAC.1
MIPHDAADIPHTHTLLVPASSMPHCNTGGIRGCYYELQYMDAAFDLVDDFDPMRSMLERQCYRELMEHYLLSDPLSHPGY